MKFSGYSQREVVARVVPQNLNDDHVEEGGGDGHGSGQQEVADGLGEHCQQTVLDGMHVQAGQANRSRVGMVNLVNVLVQLGKVKYPVKWRALMKRGIFFPFPFAINYPL